MNKLLNLIKPIITDDQVRVGRDTDGGYVINKSAMQNAKLISLGIWNDWSFEENFLKYSSNGIIMYDGSVGKKVFLKDFLNDILEMISLKFIIKSFKPKFFTNYIKKIIDHYKVFNNFSKFTSKENVKFTSEFVSNKPNTTSLDSIINNNKKSGDKFFLKIDIEGHEYRIFEDIVKNQDIITGMVIEFHEIDLFYDLFEKIINQLKENFYITHIHANNYTYYSELIENLAVYEISFINKNIYKNTPVYFETGIYNKEGLDYSNDPKLHDYIIKY